MGVRSIIDRLKQSPPKSGRVITESGEVTNAGDLMRAQGAVNDTIQSILGNVYQSHKRYSILAGESVFLCMQIDPGVTIRGISASATIIGGNFRSRLFVNAIEGTLIENIEVINSDRRLIDPLSLTGPASFKQVTSLSGGVEIDDITEFAKAQSNNLIQTASLTGKGIGGIFDASSSPQFEYTNISNLDAELIVSFIWADVTEVLDHVR